MVKRDILYILDNFLNNTSKDINDMLIICVLPGVSLVYSFVHSVSMHACILHVFNFVFFHVYSCVCVSTISIIIILLCSATVLATSGRRPFYSSAFLF